MADQEARETFSSSNSSKKITAGELSLLKSKTKRSKFVNMESEKSKEIKKMILKDIALTIPIYLNRSVVREVSIKPLRASLGYNSKDFMEYTRNCDIIYI